MKPKHSRAMSSTTAPAKLSDDELGAVAGAASVTRVVQTTVNAVSFGLELLDTAVATTVYNGRYGPGAPV